MTKEPTASRTGNASVHDLAGHFRVSVATIWRWNADASLAFPRPTKLSAQTTRWAWSDVLAWEAARATKARARA